MYNIGVADQRCRTPEEELRGLIDGLDLGDTKRNQYLNARWLKYVEWRDSRASESKLKHLSLRSAVVIGGALIPALVGLREMRVLEPYGWLFAMALIVVSLVIAICAGFRCRKRILRD